MMYETQRPSQFKFKADCFQVEVRLEPMHIAFTATHQNQPFMLIAQYSNQTLPGRLKIFVDTIQELFRFVEERFKNFECKEGIGLKTYVSISSTNRKEIVIPLEKVQLPQNIQLEKKYKAAVQNNKQLEEEIVLLKRRLDKSELANKQLHEFNEQLKKEIEKRNSRVDQLLQRVSKLESKDHESSILLKNQGPKKCPFYPDVSLCEGQIIKKGNTWVKVGNFGALLINCNPFEYPESEVTFHIVYSKFQSIYVGVVQNYKPGEEPSWSGEDSAFLQISGGKKSLKTWLQYTSQNIEGVHSGESITITVNYLQKSVVWSSGKSKLCSCELSETKLFAFARLKEEGDSVQIA